MPEGIDQQSCPRVWRQHAAGRAGSSRRFFFDRARALVVDGVGSCPSTARRLESAPGAPAAPPQTREAGIAAEIRPGQSEDPRGGHAAVAHRCRCLRAMNGSSRSAALLLVAACAAPAPVSIDRAARSDTTTIVADQGSQVELRAAVAAFLHAVEARRFDQVRALLSKSLRARYSAERLAADFAAEPLASLRLARIQLGSQGPYVHAGESASLEWASGRHLRLVHEAEGWRIASLE